MSRNLSFIDRAIRLLLAAVIMGVSLQQLSGTPLLLWSLLALVLAGTGTFGSPLRPAEHSNAPLAALLSG